MELLTLMVVSMLNIVCFFIGAKVGQKVVKGEELKVPPINPLKIYNEHQEHKEAEKEKEKLDIILNNIEKYDGTEAGQEDVPRD